MTAWSDIQQLDAVPKYVAVVIETYHKTQDAGGGGPLPVTLRVTDARRLRDSAADADFISRVTAHRLRETSGASQIFTWLALSAVPETNQLDVDLDNHVLGGESLDAWKDDYALEGSLVTAYVGGARKRDGSAYLFADYHEFFRGRVGSFEAGETGARLAAVGLISHRRDENLVRETFEAVGYGIQVTHASATPAEHWEGACLAGSELDVSGGKYSLGMLLRLAAEPSSAGWNQTLARWTDGTDALELTLTTGDEIRIRHVVGGVPSSADTTASPWRGEHIELLVGLGVRYDGSQAHVYLDGNLIESLTVTAPTASALGTLRLGAGATGEGCVDVEIYEVWTDTDDIGEAALIHRLRGPVLEGLDALTTIHTLYKFEEGTGATTDDDTFICQLSSQGTAVWVDPAEGDDPTRGGSLQGVSEPHILGSTIYNLAPPQTSRPDNSYLVTRGGMTLLAARYGGMPAQLPFDDTRVFRMYLSPSRIEDAALAARCIAKAGNIGRPGTRLAISGHASNDGTYTVVGVKGGRVVLLSPDLAVEDLASSVQIQILDSQATEDVTAGTLTPSVVLNSAVTVDAASTAIGTPDLQTSFRFLLAAAARPARVGIAGTSWDPADPEILWQGTTGIRDRLWGLGFPAGNDLPQREALSRLLRTYFAWVSGGGRTLVGEPPGELLDTYRMGHYRAPVTPAATYQLAADQVYPGSLRRLVRQPPAWRIEVRYRRNYSPAAPQADAVSPAEREALSGPWGARVEWVRPDALAWRQRYPSAAEIIWEADFYDREPALALLGMLVAFYEDEHDFWAAGLDLPPRWLAIGQDLQIDHPRLGLSGGVPMIVLGCEETPTRRGLIVVAMS